MLTRAGKVAVLAAAAGTGAGAGAGTGGSGPGVGAGVGTDAAASGVGGGWRGGGCGDGCVAARLVGLALALAPTLAPDGFGRERAASIDDAWGSERSECTISSTLISSTRGFVTAEDSPDGNVGAAECWLPLPLPPCLLAPAAPPPLAAAPAPPPDPAPGTVLILCAIASPSCSSAPPASGPPDGSSESTMGSGMKEDDMGAEKDGPELGARRAPYPAPPRSCGRRCGCALLRFRLVARSGAAAEAAMVCAVRCCNCNAADDDGGKVGGMRTCHVRFVALLHWSMLRHALCAAETTAERARLWSRCCHQLHCCSAITGHCHQIVIHDRTKLAKTIAHAGVVAEGARSACRRARASRATYCLRTAGKLLTCW